MRLELVFIPSPGDGHIRPLVEVAKLLVDCDENISVTVVIIPQMHGFSSGSSSSYIASLSTASEPRLRYNVLSLVDEPNSDDLKQNFLTYIDNFKPHVRATVESLTDPGQPESRLAGFVVDMFCTAMIDVANEFGVPSYLFYTSNATFLGLQSHVQYLNDVKKYDVSDLKDSDITELEVPSLSRPLPVKCFPSVMLSKEWIPFFISQARRFKETKGILVNTFAELEPQAMKFFSGGDNHLPKAFNDGGTDVSESLKPVKESVVSMLHLDTDMTIDEKDSAPLTPQLKQVSRLLDGGDRQENINSSTEKENMEDQDIGESKSVDTTNHDDNVIVKEEKLDGETGDTKSEKTDSVKFQKKEDETTKHNNKSTGIKNLSGNKPSRKKVDWTQELHKKFVQAVDQLGVDQAIPSRILELMKVDGLTRHNVASHLQKFRMHRRNILPKEDHNHRYIQSRENHRQIQRQYNGFQQQHRPVMAYPVWGLPGVHPPGAVPPLWPPPLQSSGQLPPWHWRPPYPTVNVNAWGCPIVPPVTGPFSSPTVTGTFSTPPATQLDEEMVDQVVKEAISKPWLPLPLGLKPPSAESVLAELSRQGISAVPSSSSSINGSRRLR